MKDYELTVVFHPDLEMNIDPALDKVKKIVETAGGEFTKEELDGKKRMAYAIKGQDFGVYYYFNVNLPPEAPAKIASVLNITDEVLRSLLVKADPRRAKLEARRKARQPEEAEGEGAEKAEASEATEPEVKTEAEVAEVKTEEKAEAKTEVEAKSDKAEAAEEKAEEE